MPLHAFVDESFVGRYILAVVVLPADEVTAARKAMRGLLQGGQKRIHFYKESDRRRSQILASIESLGAEHRVYTTKNARPARIECMRRLVSELGAGGVQRLVIERDDSLVAADRRLLYEVSRDRGQDFVYAHLRSKEDLLLCVPDAIAWCWSRGGHWRARVAEYTCEIAL